LNQKLIKKYAGAQIMDAHITLALATFANLQQWKKSLDYGQDLAPLTFARRNQG